MVSGHSHRLERKDCIGCEQIVHTDQRPIDNVDIRFRNFWRAIPPLAKRVEAHGYRAMPELAMRTPR